MRRSPLQKRHLVVREPLRRQPVAYHMYLFTYMPVPRVNDQVRGNHSPGIHLAIARGVHPTPALCLLPDPWETRSHKASR